MSNQKKICYVVNTLEFFISHRLDLALGAQKMGYEIHVITASSKKSDVISKLGFVHDVVDFSRKGQNLFFEVLTFLMLFRLLWKKKPDLTHLVTVKPVLYGSLAVKIIGLKSCVAAISGLGSIFVSHSWLGHIRRRLVLVIYKLSIPKRAIVIFQNNDDKDLFISSGIVVEDQCRLIQGSGVDLDHYSVSPEPEDMVVVTMASRLLVEKGVLQFIAAGQILAKRGVEVVMQLAGDLDPGNPSSVSIGELAAADKEGVVKFLGFVQNVALLYKESNIICLPSFYGEGLPKCLVEAAACGRAVITTNNSGCRDAVIEGETGIIVPIRSATALADAIQFLVENSSIRRQLGRKGRLLAEERYSIQSVVRQHLNIYSSLDV